MGTIRKAQHSKGIGEEGVLSRGRKVKSNKESQSNTRRRKKPVYSNINSNNKLNEGIEEYKKELDRKIKKQ